jgi:hypothetical protein
MVADHVYSTGGESSEYGISKLCHMPSPSGKRRQQNVGTRRSYSGYGSLGSRGFKEWICAVETHNGHSKVNFCSPGATQVDGLLCDPWSCKHNW